MTFDSRDDAGRKLAAYLQERHVQADLVFGLPRGGVVVAAAVARLLQLARNGDSGGTGAAARIAAQI